MRPRPAEPCIVGWSTLSALGAGRRSFADGLLAGAVGRWAATGHGPPPAGYPLADIDLPALVGGASIRTIDRMTLMVIATATMVLDEHPVAGADRPPVGLVLGTSTGSLASITGFLRDTFTGDRPYFVDPKEFPNTVMNGTAGRTAIWHGLRGLNSTVAAGHNTGLAALRYAGRMIRRGYATTLLVGAVEELSEPVAWAAHRLREDRGDPGPPAPMGEGCALFLVQDAETAAQWRHRPLARLADFEFAVTEPGDRAALTDGLARVIGTVLRRTGVDADRLHLVSLSHSGDPDLDAAESDAVDRVLGPASGSGSGARRIAASRHVGNTFSALGAFQVAAAIAVAESEGPNTTERPAIVTSIGVDGTVACALITL